MSYDKPSVLPAWAESGDTVQPTNSEIQTGWPLSNTPPSRQRFNWVLHYLANGVRYFMHRGLPDYDAAETYGLNDRVIGDDGLPYVSLATGNTANTPSTSPNKWLRWTRTLSEVQGQTGVAFDDLGTGANGYILSPSPAISAYAKYQKFVFKAANANTGISSINVNGKGNTLIKRRDGSNLQAGDIPAGGICEVVYDGTYFQLTAVNGVTVGNIQDQTGNYAAASGTNTLTATFSPALTAHLAGRPLRVLIANNNTGAVTFNPNGLGAKSVVNRAGGALVANDLVAGGLYEFVYDGTNYQVGALIASGVSAGSAGDAITIPAVTVDAKGRVTALSSNTVRTASTSQTGVSQLSTDAQARAKSATTVVLTPSNIAAMFYVSASGTTLSSVLGGTLSEAHSLGASPVRVGAFIECQSADKNYSAGDRITIHTDNGGGGFSIWGNATNVGIAMQATKYEAAKDMSSLGALDGTKWKLFLYASLL